MSRRVFSRLDLGTLRLCPVFVRGDILLRRENVSVGQEDGSEFTNLTGKITWTTFLSASVHRTPIMPSISGLGDYLGSGKEGRGEGIVFVHFCIMTVLAF